MTLSAEELYRRGVVHVNAGRFATASRALETARERTTDVDLLARIAGTLAYAAARTGDPAGAERLCLDALATDVNAATAAVLQGQVGLLALGRGDFDIAINWLNRSIAGIGEDPERRNAMYINRSVAHMQSGRLREAQDDLARAAVDLQALDDVSGLAMVQHNAGYVSLLAGDLVPALRHMAAAREVFQAESVVSAATSDVDRAEVLRDAGLVTEAERTLAEVARVFGAHRMRQAQGEAEYNLARSLLLHDPGGAAKVARAAVRRFRSLGSDSWAARAEGIRLRAELDNDRHPATPRRTSAPPRDAIEAAVAELSRLGFAGEATALLLTRQLWEAERAETCSAAAIRVPRNASLQVQLLAHHVRAARAARAGRHGEARRQAALGLDTLATRQVAFGSLDLQTSLVAHASGLVTQGVAAAVASGRPEAVFEWSERARHLSQQVVPLRPPPDPELAEDLAALRTLRAEDPHWLASPQARALAERARDRQWTSTGTAGLTERVRLAELQESLDAETAFVSYVFDGHRLGCLVVTAGRAQVVAAPAWSDLEPVLAGLRADLDVSASIRVGPMAPIVARGLERRLAALAGLLIDRPLAVAGDRRVVLTAPGALAGLPWPMLPGLRGRPFTLATSATNWVRDRGRKPVGSAGFAAGPDVARGPEEVTRAAASWPVATTLLGPSATVDAVTALASEVDVLHLATHGRHAVDNPLFSGLDLADGTLFGYDIDRMPRVPEVVVLSACEVGRSTVRWGEEAIGMTRAWLHAGAACVVAAPVVVADDLACELLGAMHAGLAAGRSPAEALAQAGLVTGATAPFQCHGSGF